MFTQIQASEALIYQASDLKNRGEKMTKESAMAKYYASEACVRIATEAVQIFGGMGVSQDTPLAHIFTTSRFCRIADGPDEVHMSQLAKLTIQSLGRR